jgi:hypothetical protein
MKREWLIKALESKTDIEVMSAVCRHTWKLNTEETPNLLAMISAGQI